MPRISHAFFLLAAACGLVGMCWGMYMGATQDMATHPAHAHLNLVGWVSLALMGTYYALKPAPVRALAWPNFWLSAAGAIVLPLGIAKIMLGRHDGELYAIIGGTLAMLGMALFLAQVAAGALRRP
jgi:hypothetical protein